MPKKAKKNLKKYNYNIIIIILCILILALASYLAYDKYFGPTYNWFNYKKNHDVKINCDDDINNAIELKNREKQNEFKKVTSTFKKAKELINSEELLSPYVDIKFDGLKLSCKKIQKDLLAIYFSDEIINTILSTSTLNNEFVDCIIKDTNESYGPRNIFSNTIFNSENIDVISIAYEDNFYLTFANNNYIIFEKVNNIWKIKQY